MNSRILVGITVLAFGAASLSAQAGPPGHKKGHGYDQARVVKVEPMIERVRYSVPVQQCWNEERAYAPARSDRTGAAIVGGAVGAIVGSAVGRGDTRTVATLGGAALGAAVGSELARKDHRGPRYETVQHCRTRHEQRVEERVTAYRVTYVYNGRRETTRMSYDPGRYVRVAVHVRPLG